MASNTLNGLRAISVRLLIPWTGVWLADVELDVDDIASAPLSGAATLVVGDSTLKGTVDPRAAATFSNKAMMRVVGGANGWDQTVPAQHFNDSNGNLSSTHVYALTAALVKEQVNDPTPINFGSDFVRTAGAASRVFGDASWYVDFAGVTQIAAWAPGTLADDANIADFDTVQLKATITTGSIVTPNTILTDDRFNGVSYTVRDVEQTFDKAGGTAIVWCGTAPQSKLSSALRNMVQEFAGVKYLKAYQYRFVNTASNGGVNLQAVDTTEGAPDLVPASVWWSPGIAAKLTPAQLVTIAFLFGDPRFPICLGTDATLPAEVSLDASSRVHIAPSGTPAPAARVGDAVQITFPPTMPVAGLLNGVPFTGVLTIVNPGVGIITTGSNKTDIG